NSVTSVGDLESSARSHTASQFSGGGPISGSGVGSEAEPDSAAGSCFAVERVPLHAIPTTATNIITRHIMRRAYRFARWQRAKRAPGKLEVPVTPPPVTPPGLRSDAHRPPITPPGLRRRGLERLVRSVRSVVRHPSDNVRPSDANESRRESRRDVRVPRSLAGNVLVLRDAMTAPRPVYPGRLLFITRRCTQRQFLLRPDTETNNA